MSIRRESTSASAIGNNSHVLLESLLSHLDVDRGPDRRGEYMVWCPFHADGKGKPPHDPNLSVSERGWYCHVCQRGGSLCGLVKELGIEVMVQREPERAYDYLDESGDLLFQVVRKSPKGFYQRRPDGNAGWINNLNGTRRVLYHLPDLLAEAERPVWIVEGEKDADRLAGEGMLATTNPGGAGKWRSEYNECLRGRNVVIIPDNDEPGRRHAEQIVRSLSGVAMNVTVIQLPDLHEKGDVSDWLGAGHTVQDLQQLAEEVGNGSRGCGAHPSRLSPTVNEAVDDPHRLARICLEEKCTDASGHLTLRFWRHQWWRWDGSCYHVIDDGELRAEVTVSIKAEFDRIAQEDQKSKPPRKVTRNLIGNVIQAITSLVTIPSIVEQPSWLGGNGQGEHCLSMANGLLDLEGFLRQHVNDLRPHTPEWFSPVHLPYDFDPQADCPAWLGFLNTIREGDEDRIRLLQEWFGYCLTADTTLQKFLVLEGDGANGKSVICDILAALLGTGNVSHVPLEVFGQRFQLGATLGRPANIASEVGELDKAAEGVLKSFTAGDRMHFDRKNIPAVHAYPTARLVLATNNRPRFTDRSSGL